MLKFGLLAVVAAVPAVVLVVATGQASAGEGGMNLQPGKWRSTTRFNDVSIPGLPPQVAQMMRKQLGRTQSTEYCIGPEDIRRPGAGSLGGEGAGDCRYDEWSYTGGRMRATIVCTVQGQGSMRSSMIGTGSSTSYSADINTTISNPQFGNIEMKGVVSGERTGDC